MSEDNIIGEEQIMESEESLVVEEKVIIDVNFIRDTWEKIREEMRKAVVGMDNVIEVLFIGLLSEGHILLEGPPGIAKTYAAQNFAHTLGLRFKRVQMTPDLLPADIIGTMVFDPKELKFRFKRGPIFTNILLVDEINRAPPKTQSALLEAMEERQITVEGVTYPLPKPFIVLATQNPIEMEGTYPLPEAQVSRFMLYLKIGYPSPEDELKIIRLKNKTLERINVNTVVSGRTIIEMQKVVQRDIRVDDKIMRYIRDIVVACRRDARVLLGCSPRASIALLMASKAYAAMQGRDFVIPDDVKHVTMPALRHRIILKPEIELSGVTSDDIVLTILKAIPVPG